MFILVFQQKMGDGVNGHWKNANRVCSPCAINYDYILKVETHADDLEYIFKMTGNVISEGTL